MIQSCALKLLDIIALLKPIEEESLVPGDVGTVVEMLPPNAVEVEFLDRSGKTRSITPIPISYLLVLNRERTPIL